MGFFALAGCAWAVTLPMDVHIHREFAVLAARRGFGRPPTFLAGAANALFAEN